MSVPVAVEDLGATLRDYPWGYFVSVDDTSRARMRAVPTRFAEGVLAVRVGAGTLRNVLARPSVTMVFPPTTQDGFSLIVDGDAEQRDEEVVVRPTSAVLHRPATRDG